MEDSDITEKDILQAVEKKLGTNDFNVLSHSLNPVDEKVGLLGDHAFLNINVVNNLTGTKQHLTFFVKLFPKSAVVAKFAEGAGAFTKEEFAYELFANFTSLDVNFIENCIGKCYVIRPNKYLILENLAQQGYIMPNKMEYLDYDSLLVVLRSVAKLHASSIIYEEKMSQNTNTTFRLLDSHKDKFRETLYNDAEGFTNGDTVDATLNCILQEIELFKFSDTLTSGKSFSKTTKELFSKIYQLVKPSEKYKNVLCHGDLWSSNIMLRSSETGKVDSCKFVDFQNIRYLPPSHDVLSVIYLTTPREFRQKYLYELIGIYYSHLEKLLKISGYHISEIIPFNDFMNSCEEQKMFAVLAALAVMPLVLSKREIIEEAYDDEEIYKKIFRGNRIYLVLENQTDERYMTWLRETIKDLKDECEKCL